MFQFLHGFSDAIAFIIFIAIVLAMAISGSLYISQETEEIDDPTDHF